MNDTDKKTIMVVDDMAAILEHAKQILKDEYKIIPCMSGAQALEIISKKKPDCVLLDINMPDMDGFSLLSVLKADEKTSAIPVILMTTELTSDIETKGFDLGADDFIIKPFSSSSMLRRISNQL